MISFPVISRFCLDFAIWLGVQAKSNDSGRSEDKFVATSHDCALRFFDFA